MNMTTRSVGHDGGTCAPHQWERGCVSAEIRAERALDAVPRRAPRYAGARRIPAESRGSWMLCPCQSTEGHDGPPTVIRVQGRAS
ncbi:hypothetical protein SAMN06309944_0644 [Micrococcales bacterium KH10]|nr:hypothetical protein SAMN06309944_0644 [Micrococcales bacterium KH10]